MRKRVLSWILALALACSLLVFPANAAEILDSGEFGSFTWVLTSDGVITISGVGTIPTTLKNSWSDWNSSVRSIVIQDGITGIGSSAFENCKKLTAVSIPDGVTKILQNSFYGCSNLISINIPDSVTTIGARAFYECSSIDNIAIPYGVYEINESTFYNCTNLSNLIIPDSVSIINKFAFRGCRNLRNLTIPKGLTSIGQTAFYLCDSLTSISIPEDTTDIGNGAFADCKSLTDIIVSENNPEYRSIDGVLFNKDGTQILCYPAGKTGYYQIPEDVVSIGYFAFGGCLGLTEVTIPDSVIGIEYSAFRKCSSLTSITLPDAVSSIGDYAFSYCTNLNSISIGKELSSIGDHAFQNSSSLTDVYYNGNESAWKMISIGEHNNVLTSATIHFNASTPAKPVVITASPMNYVGKVNSTVTFSVSAEGDGLQYQWQYSDNGGKKWTNTVTTAAYTTKLSANRDGRLVRCIVKDQYGNSVTSDAAAMRIYKLAIIKQPADFMGKSGEPVTFYVEAAGDGLSYQWQYSDNGGKKWTNTVKTSAYATKLSTNRNGRLVRCIVTDQYGNAVTSSTVSMKLYKLTITQQPVDYVGKVNSPVTFTVLAEGSGLNYKWQFSDNGGKSWSTSSVTSPVYATKLNANRDGRLVRCIVTDLYGTAVKSDTVSMKIG